MHPIVGVRQADPARLMRSAPRRFAWRRPHAPLCHPFWLSHCDCFAAWTVLLELMVLDLLLRSPFRSSGDPNPQRRHSGAARRDVTNYLRLQVGGGIVKSAEPV